MKDSSRLLVLAALLPVIIAIAVWIIAVDRTNTRWQLRLAQAGHKIDSLLTVQHIPVPPETVRVIIPAEPLHVDYRKVVDSAFQAGVDAGTDSIRSLFSYVSQPLDTTVHFSHGDTLLASYRPLTHEAAFTLIPAPIELRTLTVHDSVTVAVPVHDGRKWWEVPVAVASGAVAATLVLSLAK